MGLSPTCLCVQGAAGCLLRGCVATGVQRQDAGERGHCCPGDLAGVMQCQAAQSMESCVMQLLLCLPCAHTALWLVVLWELRQYHIPRKIPAGASCALHGAALV